MTAAGPQTPVKPPRVGPPQELLSSASFLLKRLAFALKDRTLAAFEPTGMSPYHYAVLALLEEDPRETQATIADALGYDRSQLVGWLDELEERGLIERRRDANDRRRHLVSLTPEGKRILRQLRAIVKGVDDEFFAPLDAEQRATLQELLLPLARHHEPRYAAPSRSSS
jgi:MarR family transcriptional regulator, lower aerobic nicotinate degradation pathway regulator